MRFLYLFCCVSFLFFACSPREKTKANFDKVNDSVSFVANEYMTKLTRLEQFNGVVLLKKDDQVILRKAYNMRDDKNSKLYVHEDSQFDIRSIAKLFAKVSVVDLEQKGLLNRNDLLEKYLPDFPNGNQITIEHLMHNKSGLPRELSDVENTLELLPEEVIQLASKESLEFEPGTDQRYSNVGFQLLYYIIGKVSGGSFADYLKSAYFQPLQMKGTADNFDIEVTDWSKYAYGHYWKNDQLQCVESFPNDDMKMGNFHSTVDDFAIFLSMLGDEKYTLLRTDGTILHAGGTQGKRAYVERNFDHHYTIIFLANYDAIPFEKLVKDLQSILKGEKVVMPKEVNRTSIEVSEELLKGYEGTYDFVDAGHIILTLKLEDGMLNVYQKGKYQGILYPESESIFFADKTSDESFEFKKSDSGKYDAYMDFQGVRWKGIRVKK